MLYEHNSRSVAPSRPGRAGLVLVLLAAVGSAGLFQSCSGSPNTSNITALEALLHWNLVACDATGFDHTLSPPEQLGPCRSARAMAIVHIAMFEAILAVGGGFQSYVGLPPATDNDISVEAAIMKAAHDALVSMFPGQVMTFDDALAADLALIADGHRKNAGLALGQAAASAILGMRFGDGSQIPEPMVNVDFICNDNPGFWRQDPISMSPLALGANWNQVLPFVMTSAAQFRAPAPPALTDAAYTAAYNEVKDIGGDGIATPTIRTPDQTVAGIYWGYDGTPNLGPPPRLYNQIAVLLGMLQHLPPTDFARFLALINVAQADAGLAIWESKYFYQYWRPITGIRESDPGTGPTMLGDGNAATTGDIVWTPLGAPASNSTGPNFTPPFPAYPSGHAGLGGAIFQIMRRVFGTDSIPFTFVSDEFNGVTLDNQGNPRPLLPRSYSSLSQAEEENGQSRIYLGIHWVFDKTAGIAQGNQVGDWVFDHVFQPIP